MLTQHYKLPVSLEHIQKACPGQFIFPSDESDEIIGFIDFVSDASLCIMLFEPGEISDEVGATSIADECDYQTRLAEIISEDPEIREMWADTLRG